jgi:hypothetical protein
MPLHITHIGKHKFVCGLFWQSLSHPRKLRKEAAELGKKIDSDLFVIRMDQSTSQAGFAQTSDGARRGMFSLGAIISKTLALEGAHYDGEHQPVHNWLAALKLPDGAWAYFAVRDANFMPKGDFAGTKEEVLDRLHADYGLGGWNVVIGDAELSEYGFHNFNVKRIEDLIPHKSDGSVRTYSWWKLQPVETRMPNKATIGICALLLAAGAGGLAYWKQYQAQQEDEARARAAQTKGLADKTVPWAKQPMPENFAQACVKQLKYLRPGGWSLDEYVCTMQSTAYSWSRQGSTTAYLLEQVPPAVINLNGEQASLTEPLKVEPGKPEVLINRDELVRPIVAHLQLIGLSPKITKSDEGGGALRPAFTAGGMPSLPHWETYSFTIDAKGISPVEIARLLAWPGVRIQRLTYRRTDWKIEGVMYAQ